MQRFVLGSCVAALILSGCQSQPRRADLGPPPGPILSTRTPGRVPAVTAPARPRTEPTERLTPAYPPITVTPADVRVPRGINRNKWKVIVVHHSAAPSATPRSMHDYHKRVRKWTRGLGYHFVIGNGMKYPDGELYVGSRWKRQQTGAHCAASAGRYLGQWRPKNFFNERGIGICLIGDFEHGRPTRRQLQTLYNLVAILVVEARIDLSQVYGHGEVTHKTACPGRHLNMAGIRRAVATRVAARRMHAAAGPSSLLERDTAPPSFSLANDAFAP